MVETEFSVVRYRGNVQAAVDEYKGLDPRESTRSLALPHMLTRLFAVTGDDIAEEIVWCASRPTHVNIAQLRLLSLTSKGSQHTDADTLVVLPVQQGSAGLSWRRPQ